MLASVLARGADLGTVEDQSFSMSSFRLQNGIAMPQVRIAYETYGRLAANGRNAVLIAHGYTSSHHAAGRNPAAVRTPGGLRLAVASPRDIAEEPRRRLASGL